MKHNPNTKKIPIVEEKDKHKGKRTHKEFVPKWKKGDLLTVKQGSNNSLYLVEIVSIRILSSWDHVIYYGKVLKVTQEKVLKDVGELVHFHERNGFGWEFNNANVNYKEVKWIEEE